jgi:hypothetical protein
MLLFVSRCVADLRHRPRTFVTLRLNTRDQLHHLFDPSIRTEDTSGEGESSLSCPPPRHSLVHTLIRLLREQDRLSWYTLFRSRIPLAEQPPSASARSSPVIVADSVPRDISDSGRDDVTTCQLEDPRLNRVTGRAGHRTPRILLKY